jgi:hypothetical protein
MMVLRSNCGARNTKIGPHATRALPRLGALFRPFAPCWICVKCTYGSTALRLCGSAQRLYGSTALRLYGSTQQLHGSTALPNGPTAHPTDLSGARAPVLELWVGAGNSGLFELHYWPCTPAPALSSSTRTYTPRRGDARGGRQDHLRHRRLAPSTSLRALKLHQGTCFRCSARRPVLLNPLRQPPTHNILYM